MLVDGLAERLTRKQLEKSIGTFIIGTKTN